MRRAYTSPHFNEALNQFYEKPFTVNDLTEAYLKIPGCGHQVKKAARQYVYRSIQRMIANGDLLRSNMKGSWPHYQIINQKNTLKQKKNNVNIDMDFYNDANNTLRQLTEKLNQYKVDLLTALGEAEEYESLSSETPHLRESLQNLYNQTRDKCSKLLGKIRALENIISIKSAACA